MIERRCEVLTGMEVGEIRGPDVTRKLIRWPLLFSSGQAWALFPRLPYEDIYALMRDVAQFLHKVLDERERDGARLNKVRYLHAEAAGKALSDYRLAGSKSPSYDGMMRALLTWAVCDCMLNERCSTVELPEWF